MSIRGLTQGLPDSEDVLRKGGFLDKGVRPDALQQFFFFNYALFVFD
jgi:hypothetical protein